MYDQYVLSLAHFTGSVLQDTEQEKRLLAIQRIHEVERIYGTEDVPLSKMLDWVEGSRKNEPLPEVPENFRNPNYGDCFERFIKSLPPHKWVVALVKLSVIVAQASGRAIDDLLITVL